MATWSAPGKVFLFGEHAVVYGKPGIAMAIKPRVMVTVRETRYHQKPNSPYIAECFRLMDVKGSVYVRSQLPSSSGLGSSAAVTVATLCAINDEFGLEKTRAEIADLAHQVEMSAQNGRASATDTYVSTFGGMVLVRGNEKRRLLPPQNFSLVIGNTLVSHSTSEMVGKVAELRKNSPDIANPILDSIAAITMRAMYNLDNQKELGNLMNMNHALLDALGVGHPVLSKLVLAARSAGAHGAKTTGAGGGGCMYAICSKGARNRVAGAIEGCDARAIITTIDTEGARKEKDE
ncbi:MAG TPA: mevalonate kinase [Methanocorpusculum sp.]|nr:mevalonate kinase [Candidatus Methanocorpusculum faecipullorum]HJK00543.1 mevalonate kinase [Methanocorpusculum sp.]HJK03383.1 mevalonate kinase [Methanocorpusculum sp.]HJK06883.1 mevalonate kinase [Methanocorpusculum sp.]HJK10110.1 mevalonate kinase [Methanocorpusculum sp.]